MQKPSLNKYDIFLFILIFSLIYGRYGIMYPSSIVTVLCLPFMLGEISSRIPHYLKPYCLFFSFWLFYGFISLTWTPSKTWSFDYSLLLIHCLLFLEILVFSKKARSPLSVISNAWVAAFLFSSFFAIWEILSDNHLASAREENMYRINEMGDSLIKTYATFTFYNPNTYCFYITLAFPFIVYKLANSKSLASTFCNLFPLLIAFYILFTNASRGALLSTGIMLAVFSFFTLKKAKTRNRLYFLSAFVCILLIFSLYGEALLETIIFRIEGKAMLEDNSRIALWESSISAIKNSYGLGQGVGSMLPALMIPDNDTTIYYSHNMILEIMLEYGALITLIFIYFLYLILKSAYRMRDISKKTVLYGSILAFPFYSVINSENIRPTFVWCFFASLAVFMRMYKSDVMSN